jgi:hypothetical protein
MNPRKRASVPLSTKTKHNITGASPSTTRLDTNYQDHNTGPKLHYINTIEVDVTAPTADGPTAITAELKTSAGVVLWSAARNTDNWPGNALPIGFTFEVEHLFESPLLDGIIDLVVTLYSGAGSGIGFVTVTWESM